MKDTAFCFRLFVLFAGGLVVGLILNDSVIALRAPRLSVTSAAIEPHSTSAGNRFTSDAGIVLKFIKADRAEDFESIIAKVKDALVKSSNPERRAQAQSWRVFKAVAPATNGDAVYVFELDPVVRNADYTIARILTEAFPAEASALYQQYADASSSKQHVVDLKLIAILGEGR